MVGGFFLVFFFGTFNTEEMIRLFPAPVMSGSSDSIGWPALSLCGPAHQWAGLCDEQLAHDTFSVLNS